MIGLTDPEPHAIRHIVLERVGVERQDAVQNAREPLRRGAQGLAVLHARERRRRAVDLGTQAARWARATA